MEILSPAGGTEQLIAAVRSGANAVYLGTQNFNARRNASNFDNESLESAIKYCHTRNVKIYVTMNTIITDSELKIAAKEIEYIARLGVDAVIVQDLGMYRLVKDIAPDMPVHASTQMSIHNISGVNMLEEMGFCRVVPARELSFSELKKIRNNCSIEMEVFVHGALCMCVSGQCYLSSILGQRSANRGLCAQPCRLDFKSENGGYSLSLKDLSIINELKSLEDIGINSAKIEGRMKRPEYVAAATTACKNALEGKQVDTDTLRAVFSRSGFTDAYFTGKRGRNLFGYRTKEDVVSASSVLKQIANEYRKEVPLISISMTLSIKTNKQIKLEVSDKYNNVTVYGDIPEKAINVEITNENAKKSLEKCGGTPFYLESAKFDIDKGLSVSLSQLNALRKQALEELSVKRCRSNEYSIRKFIPKYESIDKSNKQCIYARYEKANQVCDETDKIILDYEEILANTWLCEKYGNNLIAELSSLLFDENGIEHKLKQLQRLGVDTIYAPNLYAISIAKRLGFKVCGGFGLNIINSLALAEYKRIGLDMAEVSFESTIEMFDGLKKCIPCGLIAYGKMPLMTFRACPIKTESGCQNCNGAQSITDRYGNAMTVLCKNKLYARLLNPKAIYMGDKKSQLKNADFLTLYFTNETREECREIINKFKLGKETPTEFTRGLYYRKIK